MSSGEAQFSYTLDHEPTRELGLGFDCTQEILSRIDALPTSPMIRGFSVEKAHSRYWKDKPFAQIKPLAVNPNIHGKETSYAPANPISEGHMAVPVITNTIRTDQSRSYLFKESVSDGPPNLTMLKGTGVRSILIDNPEDVGNQFGKHSVHLNDFDAEATGWGSKGGVLEANVKLEYKNAYVLIEMYERVFNETLEIRAPRRVFDITNALVEEGADKNISRHFQVEYPLRTMVRASFAEYFSDPGKLWNGIDLETKEGVLEATERFNTILCAYPELNGFTNLVKLSTEDVEKVIFLLAEYENLFIDSNQDLSADAVGKKRYELAQAGNDLARKFYENNKEEVQETFYKEAEKLGKIVGLATGLGLTLHTCVSSKDAYGCQIADLDVVNTWSADLNRISDFNPDDAVYQGALNMKLFGALMGCPAEIQVEGIDKYLENVSQGFKQTIEKLDDLELTPSAIKNLKSYYEFLPGLIRNKSLLYTFKDATFSEDSKLKSEMFLGPCLANADVINKKFGVNIPMNVKSEYKFTTKRNYLGQETDGRKKYQDYSIDRFSNPSKDFLHLDLYAENGYFGLTNAQRYEDKVENMTMTELMG